MIRPDIRIKIILKSDLLGEPPESKLGGVPSEAGRRGGVPLPAAAPAASRVCYGAPAPAHSNIAAGVILLGLHSDFEFNILEFEYLINAKV